MFRKACLIFLLLNAVLFIFSHSQIYSQNIWSRTFGGNNLDDGLSAQQTIDNGFVIAGYTFSYGSGGEDVWIIKTNQAGDTLWTKIYGGSLNDRAYCLRQTSDNGYIIAGYTSSFGAHNTDMWLLKTNSFGDTLWTKTYGKDNINWGLSVRQTMDNGFIVAGFTQYPGGSNALLIKTNPAGDTLWTKTFGGNGYDWTGSVEQTFDKGYIIAGFTESTGAGGRDVWLIKTDSSGNTTWTKTFGGINNDWARAVAQTSDSGYILACVTASFGAGGQDMWLIKTNPAGDTLWTRTFGGVQDDWAYSSVLQVSDGGYVTAGGTYSFGAGSSDVWLIRTNPEGDTLWTKTYGGGDEDHASSVQQTIDMGYILAAGTNSFSGGNTDFWLIKTDSLGNTELPPNGIGKIYEIPKDYRLYQNNPNPFNPSTTIKYDLPKTTDISIRIYDLLGQEIITLAEEIQRAGQKSVIWNGNNVFGQMVSSGLYICTLQTPEFIKSIKLLLVK